MAARSSLTQRKCHKGRPWSCAHQRQKDRVAEQSTTPQQQTDTVTDRYKMKLELSGTRGNHVSRYNITPENLLLCSGYGCCYMHINTYVCSSDIALPDQPWGILNALWDLYVKWPKYLHVP